MLATGYPSVTTYVNEARNEETAKEDTIDQFDEARMDAVDTTCRG